MHNRSRATISMAALLTLWSMIPSAGASAVSVESARFFCLIEKGPYTGESLWLDLRDASFGWSIPREETVKVYNKSTHPFEVVVSNEKVGRGVLSFKIAEKDSVYLLSGDYGDYPIPGTCQIQ